ncbi:MAG: hypothetical protein K2K91_05050 [Ruminococcus sp.]|nr:hypothetical protein [Ruminococcus sp.]
MEENILNEETIEKDDISEDEKAEIISQEDDVEFLESENTDRKREGRADDCVSMQTALCMIIAVGLILFNIYNPDTAEKLFFMLRDFSESEKEIMSNPIDIISDYIKNI